MNRKQKKKLVAIVSMIALLATATALMLYALKQNINLFYTPTELLNAKVDLEHSLRLGGYVKKNSVHYDVSGESVSFIITDRNNELEIYYHGVLPNLFREGQAVVVTGKLQKTHSFLAHEVLAKHDEKYMPASLANKLAKGDGYGT